MNFKQANINVTLKQLFRNWLEITTAFHKLTKQQKDILALFLYYHYIYKQQITNDKILWNTVFDYDTRDKIQDELNITAQALYNNLTLFRKRGIIQNDRIVSFYIPELTKDAMEFKVIFNFRILRSEVV